MDHCPLSKPSSLTVLLLDLSRDIQPFLAKILTGVTGCPFSLQTVTNPSLPKIPASLWASTHGQGVSNTVPELWPVCDLSFHGNSENVDNTGEEET